MQGHRFAVGSSTHQVALGTPEIGFAGPALLCRIEARYRARSTVLVFIEAWLADAAPFGRVVAWFGAEAFDLFVLRAHITISVGVALAVIARPVSGARDCLSTVFKDGPAGREQILELYHRSES